MPGLTPLLCLVAWLHVASGGTAVYLTTTPPGLQILKERTVSFVCEGAPNPSEWVVMRHAFLENITSPCGHGWGRPRQRGDCVLSMALPWDTGVYWCQSLTGCVSSNKHNVTVSASTILDVDYGGATTLSVGMYMTLTCRHIQRPFQEPVYFYKDGLPIARCHNATNLTISNVSSADDGLYQCGPEGTRASPTSWISVTENDTNSVFVTANTTALSGGTPRGTMSCETVGLHGRSTPTPPNTDTSGATRRDSPPSIDRHTPTERPVYDDLFVYMAATLFAAMVAALLYLVVHMHRATRTNRERTRPLTPYAARRNVERLAESKV